MWWWPSSAVPAKSKPGEKGRYNDALIATHTVIEEAMVPGGGVALLKTSLALSVDDSSGNGVSSPPSNAILTADFGHDHPSRAPSEARTVSTNADGGALAIVGTLLGQHGGAGQFACGYDASRGY